MPWCKIRCVFGDGCHVNPMIWYSFMVPSQFFTAYPFGVYKSLNSTWPPAASLIVLKPQKDPLKLLIQLRHRSRGPQNLPRCPMDRRNFFAANKVILFVVKGSFFPSFSHLFRSSPFWLVETLGYPIPFTGEAPWLLYEMAMNIMNWGSTFHFHTRLKWIWWWQVSWWVTCLLHTEKHNGVWSRIQSEYQVCYHNHN